MDERRLLAPLETLSLKQRAAALLEARERGRAAASLASAPAELEDAPTDCFQRYVVEPAVTAGLASAAEAAAWRESCLQGSALRDPRVQAFFFGWHERATEILAQIADAGETSPEARARWFLGSIREGGHGGSGRA
ncbi:MAG: hypothetical protein ACRELD_04665 [Longimicrobiales bacterium]